jgi:transcriptional regulator with XRE-family HTH domain
VPRTALGEYLRARRQLLRPADVGLPATGRRRVPGLRREEIALLAGISPDYYLGLEQGRDRRPSPEVLRALARALNLDAAATAHLFALAGPVTTAREPSAAAAAPSLLRLLESLPGAAAYVQNRLFRVLAANPLARALSPLHEPGTDLVRAAFLAPGAVPDDPDPRPDMVACLRGLAGADIHDPELEALVGELSVRSDLFRRLWARHDVRGRTNGTLRFEHPRAGALILGYERLVVPSAPGQQLVVYSAEPGSWSARALTLLLPPSPSA